MRKLVYAINMTLDGCCDHTKFNPDEDTFEFFTNLTRGADSFLYGRKTYELMVPYWPDIAKNHSGDNKEENDFADAFDAVNKIIVFSKTLESPVGNKTRIVRSGLREEILKLKQEQGEYIFTGGINLPSKLLELGLIDEFYIVVHPLVIGGGTRLFEGINPQEKIRLKLVESIVFKSGSVVLRYLKQ